MLSRVVVFVGVGDRGFMVVVCMVGRVFLVVFNSVDEGWRGVEENENG